MSTQRIDDTWLWRPAKAILCRSRDFGKELIIALQQFCLQVRSDAFLSNGRDRRQLESDPMTSLEVVRARFAHNEGLPFADILTEASIREVLDDHNVTLSGPSVQPGYDHLGISESGT